jgi:Fe2+ transport system protein FeoA
VAAKLASMGILPGARLRLVRRSPAFVFRIDYSEFAVDRELAQFIRVEPEWEAV